jgi:hypothetical protein
MPYKLYYFKILNIKNVGDKLVTRIDYTPFLRWHVNTFQHNLLVVMILHFQLRLPPVSYLSPVACIVSR